MIVDKESTFSNCRLDIDKVKEMSTTVDNYIRMLREQVGLSQTDMALLIGVHKSTLSKWETGAEVPDLFKKEIVDFFNDRHPIHIKIEQVFKLESARKARVAS